MQYEDRIPPDGINTPDHHPLREFLRLSVMALIAIIVFGYLLNSAGGTLGGLIPFKYELWLTDKIDSAFVKAGQESPFEQSNNHPELQEYLQSVAVRVGKAMELEQSMPITVHYSDDDLVNAYATLGGHVYFFKGLLRLLPHENALSMLMAHEFSHVSLRHTAKGIGGGMALAVGNSLVGVSPENKLYGIGVTLSSTRFSRGMESQADLSAIQAVNKMYGHVGGAQALFELFMQQREVSSEQRFEKFLLTHPLDEQRIDSINAIASERSWLLAGETTPLPDDFQKWMSE